MNTISGKTRNGFTYEGEYEQASAGRILWTATFRRDGGYAGVRHGVIHDMQDVLMATLDDVVKRDIEATWTDAT